MTIKAATVSVLTFITPRRPGMRLVGAMLLALSAATPASAGWLDGRHIRRDDCAPCTRHAEGEYRCAHERSKHLTQLDCAGLVAYTEALRFGYNRHAFNAYQRAPVAPAPSR